MGSWNIIDNDQDSVIQVEPEIIRFSNGTLRDLKIGCSNYRLVFESNPDDNSDYVRLLAANQFTPVQFKKFKIIDGTRHCFLSQPFKADAITRLIESFHPCTSCLEICILNTDNADTRDWDKFSKAMASRLVHADRVLEPFWVFVKKVARIDKNSIFARLFHLAQSSGTGKTMLCLHLIQSFKRGIYFVYRPSGSTGYPPTTSWAESLIKFDKETASDLDGQALCLAFIKAAIQCFSRYRVDSKIVEFYATLEKLSSNRFNNFFNEARKLSWNELAADIVNLKNDIGSCFPIVLDECHELLVYSNNQSNRLPLYRAFRRALARINETKVVAICLGTKSSLNDFVLNYRMDLSARPSTNWLICPYIFIHSFDVFVDSAAENAALLPHNEYIRDGGIRSRSLELFALKCGRPLWNVYDTYKGALDSALRKLACDDKIASLTAFVMRTGASVVPSCSLAHKLVLSGMATLEYVDVLGESCYVSYCPEPVVANAARLYCGSLANLSSVMKQFLEYVDKRHVLDTGSAGEFIARVILLRAVDCLLVGASGNRVATATIHSISDDWISIVALKNMYQPLPNNTPIFPLYGLVTLKNFLKKLGGISDDVVSALGLSNAMIDGLVNLSQFIATKRPFDVNQALLKNAFLRGIGFSLPLNFPGADLMIPVYRADGRFSRIMIQVKNLDQLSIPGENAKKSLEIIGELTVPYMELQNCLASVPEQEFAKVVIQFTEPKCRVPRASSELVKVRHAAPNAGRGNVLWILGLEGFKHLFIASDDDPARIGLSFDSVFKDISSILSNARDFVDTINDNDFVSASQSQTKREGIRELLNTFLPFKTSYCIHLKPGLPRPYLNADCGSESESDRETDVIVN